MPKQWFSTLRGGSREVWGRKGAVQGSQMDPLDGHIAGLVEGDTFFQTPLLGCGASSTTDHNGESTKSTRHLSFSFEPDVTLLAKRVLMLKNCPKDYFWSQCILKRVARKRTLTSIAKIIDAIRSVLDGHGRSHDVKNSQSGSFHLPRDEHIVTILVWPCISSGSCTRCSN